MTRRRQTPRLVPSAPRHRADWHTLWRRCICGLPAPCVDSLIPAAPLPFPPRPAADQQFPLLSLHDRTCTTPSALEGYEAAILFPLYCGFTALRVTPATRPSPPRQRSLTHLTTEPASPVATADSPVRPGNRGTPGSHAGPGLSAGAGHNNPCSPRGRPLSRRRRISHLTACGYQPASALTSRTHPPARSPARLSTPALRHRRHSAPAPRT
jgi:hypothetical protein